MYGRSPLNGRRQELSWMREYFIYILRARLEYKKKFK